MSTKRRVLTEAARLAAEQEHAALLFVLIQNFSGFSVRAIEPDRHEQNYLKTTIRIRRGGEVTVTTVYNYGGIATEIDAPFAYRKVRAAIWGKRRLLSDLHVGPHPVLMADAIAAGFGGETHIDARNMVPRAGMRTQ